MTELEQIWETRFGGGRGSKREGQSPEALYFFWAAAVLVGFFRPLVDFARRWFFP